MRWAATASTAAGSSKKRAAIMGVVVGESDLERAAAVITSAWSPFPAIVGGAPFVLVA